MLGLGERGSEKKDHICFSNLFGGLFPFNFTLNYCTFNNRQYSQPGSGLSFRLDKNRKGNLDFHSFNYRSLHILSRLIGAETGDF